MPKVVKIPNDYTGHRLRIGGEGDIYCRACTVYKSSTEFYVDNGHSSGFSALCKFCYSTRQICAQHRISVEEYNAKYTAQNGLCGICFQPETAKQSTSSKLARLCLDHCEETGVVRGFLCRKCNLGIGCLNHDTSLLSQAVSYLNSYPFTVEDVLSAAVDSNLDAGMVPEKTQPIATAGA